MIEAYYEPNRIGILEDRCYELRFFPNSSYFFPVSYLSVRPEGRFLYNDDFRLPKNWIAI